MDAKLNSIQENLSILSERAASQIVQLIRDRQYAPGERIPNEADLAAQLNISRSTLREAVKILISRNVLEIRRGKGTFVSELPGISPDPWGLEFFDNKFKAAYQLLELRYIIEPQLVALAAERASASETATIKAACQETERMIQLNQPHNEPDLAFHLAIASASHNDIAVNMVRQLYSQSVDLLVSLSNNTLQKETVETHAQITAAILAHNPTAGISAMQRHLEYNKNALDMRLAQTHKANTLSNEDN